MRLGIAQTSLAPESLDAALAALDATLAAAAREGARLVLLPELYLCGYGDWARARALALPAATLAERLAPMAARAGVGMCLGFAEAAADAPFNAALLIGADGRLAGHYRKLHLWAEERAVFRPGDAPPVVAEVEGLRAGMMICYDLDMPPVAQHLARAGAELILALSATEPGYQIVPDAVVPVRAYESGLHLAFANHAQGPAGGFCGGSCLAAPDGRVLARAPGAGPAIVTATVDPAAFAGWAAAHPYRDDLRCDLFPPPPALPAPAGAAPA